MIQIVWKYVYHMPHISRFPYLCLRDRYIDNVNIFPHFSQSGELFKRFTSLKNPIACFGHIFRINGAGLIAIFWSPDNTYSFGFEGRFASATRKMRNLSSNNHFMQFKYYPTTRSGVWQGYR